MTAQLVDDSTGKTMVYVSSVGMKAPKVEGKTAKVAMAYAVGEKIASEAKAKGISKIVFDRGGYKYHGRVAALAEGARAGGLQF
jgi:large subunit ribosomal protein L18